ncbi:hypothetical protein PG997_007520 [Apiospora hydei]|uniref:Uncharacterized protein n=1 Tax=Apiospora hydei TaxID=1337664 RepID=A0ABR1W9I6_9PEZI
MALRPTYFLAPNFTFRPETGPIRLGSIIVDPLCPHRPLSRIDGPALEARYPKIEHVVEVGRTWNRNANRDVALAVWAQFLQSFSPRLSGERSTSFADEYTFESLTKTSFVEDPSDSEILERISDPKIQAVMRGDFFAFGGRPVYMITGLKIAHNLVASKGSAKSYTVSLEGLATAPAPVPVGTVDAGVSISRGEYDKRHDSWKSNNDIVFAYQLLKIKWKGLKQNRLHVEEFVHKHQLLSNDDDDTHDQDRHVQRCDDATENDTVVESNTAHDLEAINTDGALVTVVTGNDIAISVVQETD